MNRQRIRMIALVALVVAAGAYVWAQRAASTVKPAPTTTAAVKKPGAVVPPAKTSAPVANAKPGVPVAPAAKSAAPVPASKTPAAVPVPAAVTSKTAAALPAKSVPAPAAVAKAAASTPAVSATSAAMSVPAPVAAAPVVPGSWQEQLQKGSYLAEKLRARLPEGTDPLVASDGFRDLQQFVATATAAHNLKLDFEELKRRVVTDNKGLASAIDAMRKVASATIEEQRAEYEARGLIQEAKRQPAPAAPAAKASTPKGRSKKPVRAQSGV